MSASVLQVPKFGTFIAPIINSRDEFGQPSFFTMQIFTRSEPVGQRRGTLSLGARNIRDEGIWDPYAKFQLEEPSTGPPGTMHIKSCYNQKYIRKATQNPNDPEIAAMADEPEEDTSKWSCTLFRLSGTELTIQYNDRTWVVRGQHMPTPNEDIWMHIDNGTPPVPNMMLFTSFELVNLDTLPTLPTHVCFKGDNDRYLRVVRSSADQIIRAVFTGTDRREREAQFQVVRTQSRSVVLIPMAFPDTFITRSTTAQYVAAPSDVLSNRQNAPLEPVLLNFAGPAAVAFKSIPHLFRHFLVRRESDNALIVSATQNGIVAQAEFLTEDTVRSRQLSNIHFMYDDMRILNPTPVAVLTKNVVNGSNVSTQQAQLGFRYAEYHSSHWETTHSWQVGVSWGSVTTISARLPVLKFIRAETVSVEVEAGYQGEHIAGETKEEESEMSTNFTVQVPPNTQTLVNMVVTRAKVILPFSYTEREMLHDGSSKSTKKVDGLYEGEATHVDYQVQESSL